eukprot:scaffold10425_cov51-Phaeocystis_antarctica.AAC.2
MELLIKCSVHANTYNAHIRGVQRATRYTLRAPVPRTTARSLPPVPRHPRRDGIVTGSAGLGSVPTRGQQGHLAERSVHLPRPGGLFLRFELRQSRCLGLHDDEALGAGLVR